MCAAKKKPKGLIKTHRNKEIGESSKNKVKQNYPNISVEINQMNEAEAFLKDKLKLKCIVANKSVHIS